jgi:hypothetical protein
MEVLMVSKMSGKDMIRCVVLCLPSWKVNASRNSENRWELMCFDEMVRFPGFQTMKVMMDEISLFVSTQPEIQSRLRGELIDQAMRHDHNLLTFTRRRPTTHGAAN